jgi:hypothetical protein
VLTIFAADYPFLDVLWTLLVIFAWVMWFWLLIVIISDVFRRQDISGGKKALWLIFLLFVPFIGAFIYVIANGEGMAERRQRDIDTQKADVDQYIRETAGSGGPAAEIDRAQKLLDNGTITQAEFDVIKAKALSSA